MLFHHDYVITRIQHFAKNDDAGAALSALDDSEFMGSHIQVQVGWSSPITVWSAMLW